MSDPIVCGIALSEYKKQVKIGLERRHIHLSFDINVEKLKELYHSDGVTVHEAVCLIDRYLNVCDTFNVERPKTTTEEKKLGMIDPVIYFYGNDEQIKPLTSLEVVKATGYPNFAFPKFESLPNETHSQTEQRWEAERKNLVNRQHNYVLAQFGLGYIEALKSHYMELPDVLSLIGIRGTILAHLAATDLTAERIRYSVVCDSTNNHRTNLDNGCVIASISYSMAWNDTQHTCFVANKEEQWKF